MHWRIEQIIDQMGGRGVRGALGYIGASEIAYHCRKDDSKPVNSTVDDHGLIEFEIGLMFRVNAKKGKPGRWSSAWSRIIPTPSGCSVRPHPKSGVGRSWQSSWIPTQMSTVTISRL